MTRFLSNDVTVRVSPEAFTFSTGTKHLMLPTFVYLHDGPDGVTVVSVGEVPSALTAGVVRLDLFGGAQRVGKGKVRVTNFDGLEALLRFAIHALHGRWWMVRPPITVVGAESLDGVLRGFQIPLLRQAFETAGAAVVVFEDRFTA
jgi:hypothetical protein